MAMLYKMIPNEDQIFTKISTEMEFVDSLMINKIYKYLGSYIARKASIESFQFCWAPQK